MYKENPRVLVAVPYHEAKRYCLSQLYDSLNRLTYKNKEVVIRHDPGEFGRKNAVKEQREFFRLLALENKFDYLYFFGADTIPPDNVIEQLLSHNLPIVAGVYFMRRHDNANHAIAAIEGWETDEKDKVLLPECHAEEFRLVEVTTTGLDAVLIRRDVLERVGWMEWGVNDDDWPYYSILRQLGYSIMIDTNVQCQHWADVNSYSFRGKFYEEEKGK